ncbi:MAG TPA: hypothetical protein VFF14_03735 [Candidatus Deferrimicrobium sp.]|nr:hypothetical protein [Candidatus Deferrimicrobium sp.]
MPLNAERSVMDKWPLEQRLGYSAMQSVNEKLHSLGFAVWESRELLVPKPFSQGSLRCKYEGWQQGLVFRFALDPYTPAVLAWEEFYTAETLEDVLAVLLKASHPLRFSPYCLAGPEGLFVGRAAELCLLNSGLSGLVVTGESGTGKSSLLLQGAVENGGGFINCQGFGYRELAARLGDLANRCGMPQTLFLDEMDLLIRDPRTTLLLTALNKRGIAWRVALHLNAQGLGPELCLAGPREMDKLLLPLEKIIGYALSKGVKQAIKQAAGGNVGRVHRICQLLLAKLAYSKRKITLAMLEEVVRDCYLEGGREFAQRVV